MSAATVACFWDRVVVGPAFAAALEGRLRAVPIEVDEGVPVGRLVLKGSFAVNGGRARPWEVVLDRSAGGWNRVVEGNDGEGVDLQAENAAASLALSVVDL